MHIQYMSCILCAAQSVKACSPQHSVTQSTSQNSPVTVSEQQLEVVQDAVSTGGK